MGMIRNDFEEGSRIFTIGGASSTVFWWLDGLNPDLIRPKRS
ncbi:predicted protein [Sclerotinia sclerotiorum 1980 UF-70]|uniref:Uncharacterized protein n=1 Tax=Sclerotinia sclerotiorum (strain ATCC 18683 / 1980 / Ss-1) TaxID=665079 RepID=A7ELV9_SCLS1|nr:predicted protein [Sclerotinia sclerotiorum 1980 UF-70]EDO03825.1 predicted protein [Sclerotinia sclerotiorum 1980 UF-70]